MFLLDDILFSPITGFKAVLRTLQRVAEEQWTDDAPLKERLLELQNSLDDGTITEEEYVRQEAEIMRALREIRERRSQLTASRPNEPND